ncbi:MAG: hypothetical protein P8129_19550 [Anaerolineae bacterium]
MNSKGSAAARGSWRLKLPPAVRSLLVVLLVPFVGLGLLVLAIKLGGLMRYDPAYFASGYVQEYDSSAVVARRLEQALQMGNEGLLDQLQGLRWPARFEMADTISFVRLWQREGRYVTYLYVDMHSYERYLFPFEQVGGRWVVAPEDVRYYLYSGRWKDVFFPVAIGWWILGTAAVGGLWLLRHSESLRARLLDQ